ncbi:cytochrome P450 [Mycena rosella]|uniref:Cytochrome P450 n=1 Tax=Mycena rosella TaxID=1033263 RepID=A0AAD7DRP7_MYCRO|nr:cytochrome P450 [Mycena rosella]
MNDSEADSQNSNFILDLASLAVCTIVPLVSLWLLLRRTFTSNTVATIPGPSSRSWIYGNMPQLVLPDHYGEYEFQWQKRYGPLYRVKGCFGEDRLVVSDPQALRQLFNDPSIIRPPSLSKTAHLVFGEESVFCVEGEEHRSLRAAMSTGFSGRTVRTFLPVFVDVAEKIVYEWETLLSPGSSPRLNVGKMVDLATLDIICDAALGFRVNTVQNPDHPLALSHLHVLGYAFIRSKSSLVAEYFTAHIPEFLLRLALHLPFGPLPAVLGFKTVTEKLMEEKAQEFKTDAGDKHDLLNIIRSGKTDILPSQIVHQLPLFLLAGQDTTAAVLSWAFYCLAQNPEFQQNLRQEILSSKFNSQEGELEYDNMPLLNALLKETLRMFPGGPLLERWASEDCVLPLASEIVTTTGKHIRELPIQKGQSIFLALGAYQRLESLWGSDADEFKPSRWLEGDPCPGYALGPYAQLHVCIFMPSHLT